jgi:predicted esterase YcpF (UPF0227 family)
MMRTITIVYLHGYNGVNSTKGKSLAEHFSGYTVLTPEIPLNPAEALEKLDAIIDSLIAPDNAIYLVGSSLGGWYAFYLSVRYDLPVFLINPSLTPWVSLAGIIADEYLQSFKKFDDGKASGFIGEIVNAFIAKDDELLNHEQTIQMFENIRTLKLYDGVGHRFTKFKKYVIPEIERVIKEDLQEDVNDDE